MLRAAIAHDIRSPLSVLKGYQEMLSEYLPNGTVNMEQAMEMLAESRHQIERMDSFYPVVRLHQFYNIDTDIVNLEDGILLWVETSDRSFCLFVDELVGEQQVVVKPFPAFLNFFELKNFGYAGCTILGDGNISIILDIQSLYSVALENSQ